MSMKTLIPSFLFVLFASPLGMADSSLKLQLFAPKEPVTLSKADLVKAGIGAKGPVEGITLRYRITNTGKQAIEIRHGGDESTNSLSIQGPGAINIPYRGPMTLDYRIGEKVTISAGESKEFEIRGLAHGIRNMSRWSITKAGDYKVVMKFNSRTGRKRTKLKSNTAQFSVVIE